MPSAIYLLQSYFFIVKNYKKMETFRTAIILIFLFKCFATIEQPDNRPPPPTGITNVQLWKLF